MCMNPLFFYRWFDKGAGEQHVQIIKKFEYDKLKDDSKFCDSVFTAPCGKCPECCEQYSNEWAWRCMCELQLWKPEDCCFLTLTYRDNPVSLVKRDLQLFVKRLRRSLEPRKLRYFACGEYGSKGKRPHYHLLIFGYRPDDLVFFKKTGKGQFIYISKFLENKWGLGFVSVGDITSFSAKYCAKYMQKLNVLSDDLLAPFNLMSKKPGIGLGYFMERPGDFVATDSIWFNGKRQHVPRYFLKKIESNPDYIFALNELRKQRKVKADLLYGDDRDYSKIERMFKY